MIIKVEIDSEKNAYELKSLAMLPEIVDALYEARCLTKNRLKHGDDVSPYEEAFLDELMEVLWVPGISD